MNKDIVHTQAQLDDYANVHNKTSEAYKAMLDNRSVQLNPNNPLYKGDKKK